MKTLKTLLLAAAWTAGTLAGAAAEQTTVAHWEFTTGYDEAKEGTTAVYTPNEDGWAASANRRWTELQPYFLPNSCAMDAAECKVTLYTSDGKWQLTSSGSNPSYLLRLNTASTNKFTAKADYADAAKHDQYFEVAMPTTNLSNVKLNFAIGDGSSSATTFGVVYSTDGGSTWTVLDDYKAASHWNSYNDATYALDADNKESLIVRMLIQSATKTSNYNLKYLNVLADDFQAPELVSIVPADGETDVITTGKVVMRFSESVNLYGDASATLTNTASGTVKTLVPTVNGNKVTYSYEDLELSTQYTFAVASRVFADMAGNVDSDMTYSSTFTNSSERPVSPPVPDSKNRLWYHRPAAYWEEALPLGNGRLGAMVSGGVAVDTIQLNEDTFWGQSPNAHYKSEGKGVLAR